MGNLTKNFSSSEFECPCGCGANKMNAKFMKKLQTFRDVMDMPIEIVKGSGYICKDSAKSKDELNTLGIVAMPKIRASQIFKAVNVAMSIGFTGIGVKNKNGSVQLQLDVATGTDRPSLWTY